MINLPLSSPYNISVKNTSVFSPVWKKFSKPGRLFALCSLYYSYLILYYSIVGMERLNPLNDYLFLKLMGEEGDEEQ
jgi:hypothetical protein